MSLLQHFLKRRRNILVTPHDHFTAGEVDTSFVPALAPQPAIPGTFQDHGKVNLRFLAALRPAGNLLEYPTVKSKL